MNANSSARTCGSGSLGFSVWRAKSRAAMSAAHTHTDVEINFLRSGTLRYFMAGGFVTLRPGEVLLFWAGMPHQVVSRDRETEGVWATLPLEWVLRWRDADGLARRMLRGECVRTHAGIEDAARFEAWADDLESTDPARARIAVLEIEAWFSRLALKRPGTKTRARAHAGAADKIGEITDYLAARYTDDIQAADIARAVGLHPKYLHALFRKQCQIPLWEYVMRLRLAHAQRLLLTTNRTIMDVALDSGFGSVSAFYLAFRKFLPGTAPKAFRASKGISGKARRRK